MPPTGEYTHTQYTCSDEFYGDVLHEGITPICSKNCDISNVGFLPFFFPSH